MGYLFKKYEFNSLEQADQKINALPHETDHEGNKYATHLHSVVKLGYLWVTEPTFDDDGNVVTEGVTSDKYSVDVLWYDLDSSPYGWTSYEISVEGNGVHTFAGWNFND
jgi:hypothetical protein|tara:strand:+ start:132 stop:458 length:327 start_codon:yes stop_codon:yes gene_type:complete